MGWILHESLTSLQLEAKRQSLIFRREEVKRVKSLKEGDLLEEEDERIVNEAFRVANQEVF